MDTQKLDSAISGFLIKKNSNAEPIMRKIEWSKFNFCLERKNEM